MQKISILPSAVSGETQPVKQKKMAGADHKISTRLLNLPVATYPLVNIQKTNGKSPFNG